MRTGDSQRFGREFRGVLSGESAASREGDIVESRREAGANDSRPITKRVEGVVESSHERRNRGSAPVFAVRRTADPRADRDDGPLGHDAVSRLRPKRVTGVDSDAGGIEAGSDASRRRDTGLRERVPGTEFRTG